MIGDLRGTNRALPRLRTIYRRSGKVNLYWVMWCGWCKQDHHYSYKRYPFRSRVAAMHADHIEHVCKPKILDRESSL